MLGDLNERDMCHRQWTCSDLDSSHYCIMKRLRFIVIQIVSLMIILSKGAVSERKECCFQGKSYLSRQYSSVFSIHFSCIDDGKSVCM